MIRGYRRSCFSGFNSVKYSTSKEYIEKKLKGEEEEEKKDEISHL
jgi:hypothetical protein